MHGQMMQGMCGMGPGGMVAMMLAGALLWLGLVALVVLGLVIAIRWLRSPAGPATGSLPRALKIVASGTRVGRSRMRSSSACVVNSVEPAFRIGRSTSHGERARQSSIGCRPRLRRSAP